MRTSLVVALLAVAACSDKRTESSSSKPDVVVVGSGSVSAEPATAPHSGAIERIAITDDGTVAYTIDTLGQGRLWLALDGTREPIVVRGGRARRVAIGRIDDGFVVALLDQAGGLELLQLDRVGRLRGNVTLAPEPGFVDVAAVPGGVLARRRDEFLVWYDASGRKRSQLAAEAGQRVAWITVRRGRVLAAIASGAKREIGVRWVELDKALAWGAPVALKVAIDVPIALSPDGTKLAAIDAMKRRFEVVSLVTGEGMFASGDNSAVVTDEPAMGFLDDNTAVFSDARGTVWWALSLKDPWSTSRRRAPNDFSDIAIGDRVMLDATSAHLTLTTETSMRYLGYRDMGASVLWSTATGVATLRGSKGVWLDRDLRESAAHVAPSGQVSAILGDHHFIVKEGERVFLYDAMSREEKTIGTFDEAFGVSYDAASEVLFVSRFYEKERLRFAVTPASVAPLPSFGQEGSGEVVSMNPAEASGLTGMMAKHVGENLELSWFREKSDGTTTKPFDSTVVGGQLMVTGADEKGVVYFLERAQKMLVMIQHARPVREVSFATSDVSTGKPHPDGSMVVVATANEVVALDTSTGAERWKLTVPNVDTLTFSVDGRTLFAMASGGLVSIEPRNGTRLAVVCGWNFGLHDDQVSARVFSAPNLCGGLE
ncbi:MAG: hypothetical protein ACKV2T_14750 [Kofleriaceae bacterium]